MGGPLIRIREGFIERPTISQTGKAIVIIVQARKFKQRYIVESLKKKVKKEIEKPDHKKYVSSLADPAEKAAQDKFLEKEYDRDFKIFQDDERRFENNWHKAYAMVWKNYSSKEVQVALEKISDSKGRIGNNSLELLNKIETLMHVPVRPKYPPPTLVEVLGV